MEEENQFSLLIVIFAVALLLLFFSRNNNDRERYSTHAPSACIYVPNQRPCPEGTYCMIPGGVSGTCHNDKNGVKWCCPSEKPSFYCCGKECTTSIRA